MWLCSIKKANDFVNIYIKSLEEFNRDGEINWLDRILLYKQKILKADIGFLKYLIYKYLSF